MAEPCPAVDAALEGLPRFMTTGEAASVLRCRREFVSALVSLGELAGVQRRARRKGSPLLIPKESLRDYLQRSTR